MTTNRFGFNPFGLKRHLLTMLLIPAVAATGLALLLLWGSLTTTDAESRLVGAGLGSIGTAFLLPFWGLLRYKIPLWVVVSVILASLLGMMQLSAWAVEEAQDHQVVSRFYEYWYLLLFSVPGFIALYRSNHYRKPNQPAV